MAAGLALGDVVLTVNGERDSVAAVARQARVSRALVYDDTGARAAVPAAFNPQVGEHPAPACASRTAVSRASKRSSLPLQLYS
jgi:hypothetical protein